MLSLAREIVPEAMKIKLDYFERKLSEFQVQMRQLDKVNKDAMEEHAAMQAWAMSIKPYRKYEPAPGIWDHDGETDP